MRVVPSVPRRLAMPAGYGNSLSAGDARQPSEARLPDMPIMKMRSKARGPVENATATDSRSEFKTTAPNARSR